MYNPASAQSICNARSLRTLAPSTITTNDLTKHHQHGMPTKEPPAGAIWPGSRPVTPKEGMRDENGYEEDVFACWEGCWFACHAEVTEDCVREMRGSKLKASD